MSYYCTDFSEAEDWTVGERTYLANVGLQTTRFEASFASGAWIRLNVGGGGWEVRVKGDLSIRADLGRINTSPVTATQPIVRIQSNCPTAITIPVEDADGDVVKCRWAEGSQSECSGVCMAFPHATLDEKTCTLRYNGNGGIGWYAVALQIEDFSTSSSTTPLSSVPLQFLVNLFQRSSECGSISPPTFVGPTPSNGEKFNIARGSQFTARITAQSGNASNAGITRIQTISPLGLVKSALVKSTAPKQWYIDVTWTPTSTQDGPQIFCFQAFDSSLVSSEQRCITLQQTINVDPPSLKLLRICYKHILFMWNIDKSVEPMIEKFRLRAYQVKGRKGREVKMYTGILDSPPRLFNFARRKPGSKYKFVLDMKMQGNAKYGSAGSLLVNGTCPTGNDCCLFF
jgi:hypothetical protein